MGDYSGRVRENEGDWEQIGSSEWEEWAVAAEEAAERCDDVPEPGEDFAAGVQDKLYGIATTIRATRNVTGKQRVAINNMDAAIGKWIPHG